MRIQALDDSLRQQRLSIKLVSVRVPKGSTNDTQLRIIQGDLIKGYSISKGVRLDYKGECNTLYPVRL
jgi:hypothetical protein